MLPLKVRMKIVADVGEFVIGGGRFVSRCAWVDNPTVCELLKFPA